jgi:uncharacterized protein (TIGR03083 family)
METAKLIGILADEGGLLGDAAEKAGPDADVPPCPGWQVRDLLGHIGRVHRWAARYVAEGLTGMTGIGAAYQGGDAGLPGWYRDGHRSLVETLAAAPPDVRCAAFLPAPSQLAFWARRMAHETVVHRVDAESALGRELSPIDAEFAADGIDELLTGFHAREQSRVRTSPPRTLRLRATDTAAVWTVRLSDGIPHTVRHNDGDADCEVAGPAAELYPTLWNRLPYTGLRVTGDGSLAQLWRDRSAASLRG